MFFSCLGMSENEVTFFPFKVTVLGSKKDTSFWDTHLPIWVQVKIGGPEQAPGPHPFHTPVPHPRSIPPWRIRSIPLFHTSVPYLWSIHYYIYIYMAASQNVKPRSIPWTHRPIHTPDPYQNAGDPDRSIRLDHRGPIHTIILTRPHIYIYIFNYI